MKLSKPSIIATYTCGCDRVWPTGCACRFCQSAGNLDSATPPAVEVTPGRVETGAGKKRAAKRQQMNGLEAEFLRTELRRLLEVGVLARVQFQPFRLYLANGHSYRPDFAAWERCGCVRIYECKGPFIHSRDSQILFDQAAVEYPEWRFFWARKNPTWEIVEAANGL